MNESQRKANAERRLQIVDRRTTGRAPHDDHDEGDLNLLEYWHIVLRYRWSILALVLVGAAIGILTAAKAVPLYKAETRIHVKYNQPNLANVNAQQFQDSPLYWYF